MTIERDSAPLTFDFHGKYKIVGKSLRGRSGTLLDVGSRDAVLKQHLPAELKYLSADLGDHADYSVNLEHKLQFEDGAFDIVVALDVLEHVENFHFAFSELLRICKSSLIIGLPNLALLEHRAAFLFSGRLATDKYDLPSKPAGDRHRWLTTYSQVLRCFAEMEKSSMFKIEEIVAETGGGKTFRLFGYGLLQLGLPLGNILCARTIHFLAKQ